jgi:hypothetical protein
MHGGDPLLPVRINVVRVSFELDDDSPNPEFPGGAALRPAELLGASDSRMECRRRELVVGLYVCNLIVGTSRR